jgi:hypothetical protein
MRVNKGVACLYFVKGDFAIDSEGNTKHFFFVKFDVLLNVYHYVLVSQ